MLPLCCTGYPVFPGVHAPATIFGLNVTVGNAVSSNAEVLGTSDSSVKPVVERR